VLQVNGDGPAVRTCDVVAHVRGRARASVDDGGGGFERAWAAC
jgi:succinyl-CoA synthetase beta subunit